MKTLVLFALAACTRPGEQRALDELAVGHAEIEFAKIEVSGGLAVVRELAARSKFDLKTLPAIEGLDESLKAKAEDVK